MHRSPGKHHQFNWGRGLRGAALGVLLSTNLTPFTAAADTKDQFLGSETKDISLQEVLRKKRDAGNIFVAIPLAYTFGIPEQGGHYCSPTIRVTNSSNSTVEELIVGIRFRNAGGKVVGSSVTRYFSVDVGQQDAHYFYQIQVPNCQGLSGEMTVVRCAYANGRDCGPDVRALDFGAIPLTNKANP